jgi:hypothetical protein
VAEFARQSGKSVLDIDILPFGHDTPAQVLLKVAALAPDSEHARALTAVETAWQARLGAAAKLLDGPGCDVVLVHFPAGSIPSGERADRQLQQETLDVVSLVTKPRPNRLHVIAAQNWWKWPHDVAANRIELPLSSASTAFLADESVWGPLSQYAARLKKLLGADGDRCSPLQLRLGVALLATGTAHSALRNALTPGSTLRDLEGPLRKLLDQDTPLEAALTRVARARTAVNQSVMEDIAAAGEHWELIRRCFLYPDEPGRLRFHDQLRWLVPYATSETLAHTKLSAYYGSMDGAVEPAKGLKNVVPWLEKLHHASRADPVGAVDAWLAMAPPTREHYWEYGWSLSYVHKRYSAAARVYRELLNRVPDEDDNYGQHYYAYNLDRAGEDPVTAEAYYRRAVDGDPSNAWWNSRLVSFLAERGRFEASLRAWNAALEAIDPGGDRSGGEWLPYHLHKHAIQAGLATGHLALADAAHRSIHAPAANAEVFRWLRSEIDAATEVHRLGESLFPAHVSFPEWWRPRLLRPRHDESIVDWRAGRVVRLKESEVAVVLGSKGNDGRPHVEYQVLSRKCWDDAAHGQAPREGDFFEFASINGEQRLEAEAPEETPADRVQLEKLLRYISTQAWQTS